MSSGETRIEIISKILRQIRGLRRADLAFGVSSHKFESTPVPESELVEFERAIGVTLPREYRLFLTQIGHGAGPHNGLYSPTAILDELALWREDAEEAGLKGEECGHADPSRPAPVALENARWAASQVSTLGPYLPVPIGADGAIVISHHGCDYYTLLITAGVLAGTVFDYCAGAREMAPAIKNHAFSDNPNPVCDGCTAIPPSFLDWYECWLFQIFHRVTGKSVR